MNRFGSIIARFLIAVVFFGAAVTAFPQRTQASLTSPYVDPGSLAIACQYFATPPATLTVDGQWTAQCDANGNLKTAVYPAPSASPFPVVPVQQTWTNVSGSITAGGTAQTLYPSSVVAHGCSVQNTSSENEEVRFDGTAATATTSLILIPYAYWGCDMTGAPATSVSILGATTGDKFYAVYW